MNEKLILKRTKDWGSNDTAIRIPDELTEKIKDISADINMPVKYVCAELIDFALKNYQIVD
ncbi:hypothetical protein [Helcococcus kunzii]|uniref:hypothetical protein n=1 Tax=Helcococcus kunzii TaxID=40091 RepID=UPI0024AD2D5D|nr:hypothetical protein [Helcococcus kunzii]